MGFKLLGSDWIEMPECFRYDYTRLWQSSFYRGEKST